MLDADKPVLVDFFATWCGPCQRVSPILDEVASEMADRMLFCKVDIDQSPDIAAHYGINSVPTLAVFEGGNIVRQTVGAQPKEDIVKFLG